MTEALKRLDTKEGEIALYSPEDSRHGLRIGNVELIDGSHEKKVLQVMDGSIIKLFDKTPMPTKRTDVVCPHFLQLKWAYGCPYDCSWCYLKGTLRLLPTKTAPVAKNIEKTRKHLQFFLDHWTYSPALLNAGELADSLMFENTSRALSLLVGPLVSGSIHKVLFVTKSDKIQNLLDSDFEREIVVSYSLNSPKVSERWEKGAPNVERRLEAARQVSESGYVTRLRIDPLVPVNRWVNSYIHLIDEIFRRLEPERITLGSLRGLQSTINNVKDKTWVDYLDESSNWGKKIPYNVRCRMYESLVKYLRSEYSFDRIALCKETVGVWENLDMDFRDITCNCVP
jgi:spore photoproduct lyase